MKRDPRTGRYFFRVTLRFPDGTTERAFGTPGNPGPYEGFPNTERGAKEAEGFAKAKARLGERLLQSAKRHKEGTENEQLATNTKVIAMERGPLVVLEKTIREHAEVFSKLYKPECKPSEKRSKRQILDCAILPTFGHRTISEMDQQMVDAFTGEQLARGLKVKTINNRLAVLSSLIKYATSERSTLRLNLNGADSEIVAVALEDVDRLLSAAEDPRDRYVVLAGAEAGLRAGEIRALQWVDDRGQDIVIRHSMDNATNALVPPKHNKIRTVPTSPRLRAALDALPRRGLHVLTRRDGAPLGYCGLHERVAALYERSGVDRPPMLIHCLRHTFGTEVAKRVVLPIVQALMGHEDISTTMRYVDVNERDKRSAIVSAFGGGTHVAAEMAANERKAA
ncbi:MAG TPA: tyrosine-type recombinase/integrase [Kofleriaceae bacterium]